MSGVAKRATILAAVLLEGGATVLACATHSNGTAGAPIARTEGSARPLAAVAGPSAAPSASATLPIVTPAQPVDPQSPFRLVLEGYDEPDAFVMHQEHLLSISQQRVLDLTDGRVLRGPGHWLRTGHSGARLWLTEGFSPWSVCPETAVLSAFDGQQWKSEYIVDVHAMSISSWLPGCTIAAVVPRRYGPPWGYELVRLDGSVAPPKPTRATGPDTSTCYSRLESLPILRAFRSGEIFAFSAQECRDTHSEGEETAATVLVERWAAGASKSVIDRLPITSISAIYASSVKDIAIVGPPKAKTGDASLPNLVLRFDGKKWVSDPRRQLANVPKMDFGVLPPDVRPRWYVLESTRVVALESPTHSVPLPRSCQPVSFWLAGSAAWLQCQDRIYSTAASAVHIALPSRDVAASDSALPPHAGLRTLFGNKSSDECGCGGPGKEHLAPPHVDPFE